MRRRKSREDYRYDERFENTGTMESKRTLSKSFRSHRRRRHRRSTITYNRKKTNRKVILTFYLTDIDIVTSRRRSIARAIGEGKRFASPPDSLSKDVLIRLGAN